MSNQPQKKKTRFLSLSPSAIREGWRSLRSRPPSPSNAAQTGPSAGVSPSGAPSPLMSRSPSPSGHNMLIQSVAPPASAAQVDSSKPDKPSSYPAKENAKTTLKGAYELLKVLKESADACPPLKSAVGGIIACVEAYKNTSGNHEEMERILKSTDLLASTLAAKLEESKDHKPLDQILKKLSKSLEEEDRKIKAMYKRGFIVRLAYNSDDAGELISSCQAIKDALDTFYVGLTLLVERNTHDILKHVVFKTLPRSRDAAFSAAINLDNVSRGPCTKDTRVDIIEQIMEWVKEPVCTKAPSVYWLNGLAGLGKTTIAYTICEQLEEASIPFASFFCSRQLDSKDSKLLITMLCRNLAEQFSSFASAVLPVLERDSSIVDARLR
ncbi:hypothetical protein H0H81_006173 [Sphagnurus paluster]|uniref:Nephrocystin 3-like N-terminal domain-containing protein n=1 Tax=Sphagnurus paluster TaxID=117069 RepID=A0A9P7KH17_9AGAR|nr:hypothetical protein H0H81_006173 [Sphagnurus paluster]